MAIAIINFDGGSLRPRKVEMFPDITRCGIFGPSGCGKTNVLLTILMHKEPIRDIYLCCRTAFQEKYSDLEKLIKVANSMQKSGKKINFFKVTPDNLESPEKTPEKSIVIFDDVLTDNQTKIANFFIRGRHRGISCFYLSQSYTKIPKKSAIRENFNFLILFKQDTVNLRQLYNEYACNVDIFTSYAKFVEVCQKSWREPYGFLVLDIEKNIARHNFSSVVRSV